MQENAGTTGGFMILVNVAVVVMTVYIVLFDIMPKAKTAIQVPLSCLNSERLLLLTRWLAGLLGDDTACHERSLLQQKKGCRIVISSMQTCVAHVHARR